MTDKIINTLEREIHLAEYVCSDYCDGVEISIIKNVVDIMKSQKEEIEKLQELVNEMGDFFPACINCEGKTTLGERTDKCVYLIDNTNYCTQRGIKNICQIINENNQLKAEIEMLKTKNTYVSLIDGHIEAEKDGAE